MSARTRTTDLETVRDFVRHLAQKGSIHEIRIPKPKSVDGERPRFYGAQSGYFDNSDDIVQAVKGIRPEDCEAVYFSLNPVRSDLLARANNRLSRATSTTADGDITALRNLLIDIDSERPAGISATEEEKQAATELGSQIVEYLSDALRWPAPVVVMDTGNGRALIYRIDLLNEPDDVDLQRRTLLGLAEAFDNEAAHVDPTVFNPARIVKLAGTWAAKGDEIPGRPHRLSAAEYPDAEGIVSRELLESVAIPVERQANDIPQTATSGNGERLWSVEELLTLNSLPVEPRQTSYGIAYDLDRCLTSDDHTDGAVIIEMNFGALVYRCQHNRCQGKGWRYLRENELIEIPGSPKWSFSHNGHTTYSRDAQEESDEDQWLPVAEIPASLPKVPVMPPELLPEPLRTWLVDAADRASLPLEMFAAPAIVALSTVVGRQVGIQPARADQYLVVSNLWGAVVARPSMLKTHAANEGHRPLRHLAADARAAYELALPAAQAKLDRIEAEIAVIKKNMRAAAEDANHEHLRMLEIDLREKQQEYRDTQVHERRYMTSDPTTEKLIELLSDNPRGLLVNRDELAGFFKMLERHGRESDRAFYLESWDGKSSFTQDRIGRGTLHVKALCLSIFGTIQPARLQEHIDAAVNGGSGDDGMLQRFQIIVWSDSIPYSRVDRVEDDKAFQAVYSVFRALDSIDVAQIGAVGPEGEIPALRFDPEAQLLYDIWRDELEDRLRSGRMTQSPGFESHLGKNRSLMPSLALLFHLVDVYRNHPIRRGAVSLEAAKLAAAWCDFLEQHARRVYAAEVESSRVGAHALAERIRTGHVQDRQALRDIYRAGWSKLSTVDDVRGAIEELSAVNWCRIETSKPGERGGRPSDVLRLHPEMRG